MDRKMSRVLFGTALVGAVVLATLLLEAQVGFAQQLFYVDQATGNDSNSGTSESSAWATLDRAMSVPAGSTVLVKNGTYSPAAPSAFFQNANSGTAIAPIAFRAFTPPGGSRHQPRLTRPITSDENNPVIVVSPPSMGFITWDGFVLDLRTDVAVVNAANTTIENLLIDKGPAPCIPGNYVGIYVNHSSAAEIRNNTIRNISYIGTVGGCTDLNASGITLFDSTNIHIHHNDISSVGSGIHDKRNGVGNIHELNYVHEVRGEGVLFNNFPDTACGTCPVQDNQIRQNVIANAGLGVAMRVSTLTPVTNNRIFNNTIYIVRHGVHVGQGSSTKTYNNIIHLDGSLSSPADYVNTPPDLMSNFSNFTATIGAQALFLPFEFGAVLTLSQWQAQTGQDLNSRTTDPLFVGPLTGTPPAAAFRLQSGSPLTNAGRVGGIASGSPVNMGAYIFDSDVIGTGTADVIPPSAPTNLRVQ